MIYFVTLICAALPSYLIRFSLLGIPTTLLEILIYIAAIATLVNILIKKPKEKFIGFEPKIFIPAILFMVAGVISVIISPDRQGALGLFKAYVFDPIIFFAIMLANVKNKKDINLIISGLILSALLVSLQAIWQKITGNVAVDGRVVGIFGYSPNYLALYLVPIAVLNFGFIWFYIKKKSNNIIGNFWHYVFTFILIFIAIILSGSRAAIGAIIIGIFTFLSFEYWQKIKSRKFIKLLFYCSIVLLLITAWLVVKPDWAASKDAGRVSSSNNIRWEIWKTTVYNIIPQNNIWLKGVGLGNYQNYFNNLTQNRVNFPEWISPLALTPHNIFLTIWLNLGILGLIVFTYLLVSSIIGLVKNKNNIYRNMLLATIIAFIVQGMVDSPYWKNDLAIIFWVLIALIVISNQEKKLL